MTPSIKQNYLLCFDLSFDTDFELFLPTAYLTYRSGKALYVFKKSHRQRTANFVRIIAFTRRK
ncbi:hypothetical protein QIU19_03100 [Capnocytophaga canimorsus]|nr:hypothetical protein [Capnocytophaga canimorsus]WGU68914.1 hypothetical protein QIU19_03100 [Capnocytophaga canimorsus]